MKFNRSQTVSFKPVDDGQYVGVLVGFCYVGMHATKEWGDKPKVMLRWELHNDYESHALCVDDEGLTQVVTQTFPATIQGENSWLYKCLLAHGIAVPSGSVADSHDWYGKVALLTVESVPGTKAGKSFANVKEIEPLDHNVNIKPTLKYEHWEAEDENPPPSWAKFMIERSSDIYQRVNHAQPVSTTHHSGGTSQGKAASQEAYRPPAQPEYRAPDDDDQDIPF